MAELGTLETRKLGLAAYIKMQGGEIVEAIPSTNTFVLRDPRGRTLQEWELEYMNTCCCRHDMELVQMRRMLKRY